MKKKALALNILFFMISTLTFAQTEKGNFLISGQSSISFQSSYINLFGGAISSEDYISKSGYELEFSPSIGYFFVDNLVIGFDSYYILSDGDYQNKTSQFAIMPTVIYYFLPDYKIHPFIQAGFGYTTISQKISLNTGSESTQSFKGNTWGGALGTAFLLTNYVSIDLILDYTEINTKFSGDSAIEFKTKGFGAMVGLSFYF